MVNEDSHSKHDGLALTLASLHADWVWHGCRRNAQTKSEEYAKLEKEGHALSKTADNSEKVHKDLVSCPYPWVPS